MYHSRVRRSSCFFANAGSIMASGIQWNAVSHAAKKGYCREARSMSIAFNSRKTAHLPLVGHRQDIGYMKMFPLLVSDPLALRRRGWLRWIAIEPFGLDELVVLLRPDQSLRVSLRKEIDEYEHTHHIIPPRACLMIAFKSSVTDPEINLP